MLATEIGRDLAWMDCQHAQADYDDLQSSDRLGHSHALTADVSDGVAGTMHAERSAHHPAGRAAGRWMRRPPPHAPTAHDAQRAVQDGNSVRAHELLL